MGNATASGSAKLSGFSARQNFGVERLLLSKENFRLSMNNSLTLKKSASYVDQEKIETSERRLSILNLGFSISSQLANGANLYLKPSFAKGIKILNAKKDGDQLKSDTPRAQFEVMKFYASISRKFTFPKTNIPVILSSEMDSQIAKSTLFGSEQFSVGGYYSVRGFRENYLNGDSGYYFRNKANFNLGSLTADLFPKHQSKFFYLNKFKLEPFYDYGHTQTKYNGAGGRLAGAGVKTIFESKYFNASATFSNALQKSKLLNSPVKENRMIYFELSASCC